MPDLVILDGNHDWLLDPLEARQAQEREGRLDDRGLLRISVHDREVLVRARSPRMVSGTILCDAAGLAG